jgi:CheY-like chemotaxis protein
MSRPLEGALVLLADDHRDTLELIEFVVRDAGASVKTATSAAEVLSLLTEFKPDALLLDIAMPDLDGYQLLEAIRAKHHELRDTPAIAVTGRAFERDKRRAAEVGFVGHVVKPYDPEALIHLVRKLLDKSPPPENAAAREFVRVSQSEGLHAALELLNRGTDHRFTGVYRFDRNTLRSVHLFDRLNPTSPKGEDAPMAETYCSLVNADRKPFSTVDTEADPRLTNHPARLTVRSYCGALLRNADSTPFGSLCHFDLVPHGVSAEALEALDLAAPVVSAQVAEHD